MRVQGSGASFNPAWVASAFCRWSKLRNSLAPISKAHATWETWLPAPLPVGGHGFLRRATGGGNGCGEVIVPDKNAEWSGGDDPNGGFATIDDLEGLTIANLGLHRRPMGFHFADCDGFHGLTMISDFKLKNKMGGMALKRQMDRAETWALISRYGFVARSEGNRQFFRIEITAGEEIQIHRNTVAQAQRKRGAVGQSEAARCSRENRF